MKFFVWRSAIALVALSACSDPMVAPDASDVPPVPMGCDGNGRGHCVSQVSVGAHFGCATLGDRTVWCWGRNDESQLGYGTTDLCPEQLANGMTHSVACHMYPLQVTTLDPAVSVTAGGAHACARLVTGEVRCWGSNGVGQLGNDAVLPSVTPVAVGGIAHATAMALGARHSCVLADGLVRCWGANDRAQLGAMTSGICMTPEGMTACARSPVEVAGLTDVVELVTGDAHTCARTNAGRVLCWGTNADGELGTGTASPMPTLLPQPVKLGAVPLTGIRALAAGGHHTCALRDDGGVFCWGRNDRGQLGVAIQAMPFEPCANACSTSAVAVTGYAGMPTPIDPDAGMGTTDAGMGGGDAMSANDAGVRLDTGVRPDAGRIDAGASDVLVVRDAGVRDSGIAPAPMVTSIAAASAFSCMRLEDGTVRCWGVNRAGQLGNGQMTEGGPTLVLVIASPGSAATNPLQNARSIEAGGSTACALAADGSLRCWGSNEDGALGEGSSTQQSGPVPVTW